MGDLGELGGLVYALTIGRLAQNRGFWFGLGLLIGGVGGALMGYGWK